MPGLGSPPAIDSGMLFDFLTYLRDTGYLIGARQYVLGHDLLAAMVAQSGTVEAETFLAALCPVVAKSAREQAEFRKRFDIWTNATKTRAPAAQAPAPDRASDLDRELKSVAKGALIVVVVLVSIGAVAAGFFWWFRPAPLRVAAPTPEINLPATPSAPAQTPIFPKSAQTTIQTHSRTVWGLAGEGAGFTGILVMAWFIWWRLRARRFLARKTVTSTPDLTAIQVDAESGELFPVQTVRSLGRALRRRVSVPSNAIAVGATVEKTSASGGQFTPVYGFRQVMPEYLFLVDRCGHVDENARFAFELSKGLDRGDRLIRLFYFNKDPALVFPEEMGSRPVQLNEIATQLQSSRLVVFADAGLVTSVTVEQVQASMASFASWEERFWVTPLPVDDRLPQEKALRQYFQVYSASVKGLEDLGRKLGNGRHDSFRGAEAVPLQPRQLQFVTDRWIRRTPAPDEETDELMLSLRIYLGEAGFDWLCACAVYPEIHPRLVSYIGKRLPGRDRQPIYDAGLYLRLTNLLWFREGWMPEWIRERLIDELTPTRVDEIRGLLEGVLLTSLRGEISGLELKVAQQHPEAVSRLVRSMLPQLSREAPSESPFADIVFVSFLAGRSGVPLPRVLLNFIRTGVASGRVRNLELAPTAIRRTCRVFLFLLAVCCGAGVVGGVCYALKFLSGDNEAGWTLGGTLFSHALGCVVLWPAWRTRSRPVLTAAITAIMSPLIAAALILFGSQSSAFAWFASITGATPLLVLWAAWRSCRYIMPNAVGLRRGRMWLYSGLALATAAFLLPMFATVLGLSANTGIFFDYTVGAALSLPIIVGPVLLVTAMRHGVRQAFLAGTLLLAGYAAIALAVVAALVTSSELVGFLALISYFVLGLVLCYRGWQQSRLR